MSKIRHKIVFKSLAGIVFLLIFFSIVVGSIGYKRFTEVLSKQYEDVAFHIAETAALDLNADLFDTYIENKGTSSDYKETWDRMNKLCNSEGATFIYVIQPDLNDYKHITFLFSTVNENSKFSPYEFGFVKETTNEEYRRKYKKMYEGNLEKSLVIRDSGYIESEAHITAMIPIKDSNQQVKGILCVQRQMEALVGARHSYLRTLVFALILIVIFVLIGQALYLNRVLLFPVQTITKEASRFAEENILSEHKLSEVIKNKDEIGMLAKSIDKMEEQIHSYIDNITQITAEKERISTELSLATAIQEGMLPNVFPPFPEHTEFDLYASMSPAKEVGGDFYDFFLIDDDHLCMVMADVSGKGIPAALFMMASKIILANNVLMNQSPAEVLEKTNNMICSNNKMEMFVTVWLGILEISTGKVTAANAGHEYPIIMKPNGEFELLKDKHGFVIGGMSGIKYSNYEFVMEAGSKLFLYTDGIPEATNGDKELFGTDRTLEALNAKTDGRPEDVLHHVRSVIDEFVGEAEQFDDITMLCTEYYGNDKK
ncbi:MAG: SpoIIE family protein phosphatase [Lachnospiraceae bacterium]|nr:SpoIIE family protein phosphatase [Lachnospiraceae bacterium]